MGHPILGWDVQLTHHIIKSLARGGSTPTGTEGGPTGPDGAGDGKGVMRDLCEGQLRGGRSCLSFQQQFQAWLGPHCLGEEEEEEERGGKKLVHFQYFCSTCGRR